MIAATLANIAGCPFAYSDAVLEALPAAGGAPETATHIACEVARRVKAGLDIAEEKRITVAGVELIAKVVRVELAPTTLCGLILVTMPSEAGAVTFNEAAPGWRQ